MKILLLNGPNLNLLGIREPEIYGRGKLTHVETELKDFFQDNDHQLVTIQSNYEGELIDFLHKNMDAAFAIINAGALTHTSIGLHDAFAGTSIPFVEVHISNVYAREAYRHLSYLSSLASGSIVGCGLHGYRLAAEIIVKRIEY